MRGRVPATGTHGQGGPVPGHLLAGYVDADVLGQFAHDLVELPTPHRTALVERPGEGQLRVVGQVAHQLVSVAPVPGPFEGQRGEERVGLAFALADEAAEEPAVAVDLRRGAEPP